MSQWDDALVMAENGLSVIPINQGTEKRKEKVPLVKWQSYQTEAASEEQIDYWAKSHPQSLVGIVTGAISGIVVVDCDTPDAIAYAKECGVWSPVRVKTRRGLHLVFAHPLDGRRFGPRVGSNSTGYDWPDFPGLDFRGDGSYVVAYNSPDYQLDCDEGHDFYDLDTMPVWSGWPMPESAKDIDDLDLSTYRLIDGTTEWERTAEYVANHYPGAKIPTGANNGRNARVTRLAGEAVASGLYGEELKARVVAFMDTFFMDRLDKEEYEATCRSVEAAERRNHPERVAKHEAERTTLKSPAPEVTAPTLLFLRDADKIASDVAATPLLVEPFLPRASIVHVSGYTGHGKSIVVSHLMAAASAGRPSLGPFEIPHPSRCLYLDYENGRATLAKRLSGMFNSYGDPDERLAIWTPWLTSDDMPLFDNAALSKLSLLIRQQRPDVVVIDTARSAFPGLEENDAKAWSPINALMKRLQNYGVASILLHHKNKPQQGGFSREAGSTAQLNVVETQLYITQVYQDKGRADATAGIHDDTYTVPVWPKMIEKAEAELGTDWYVAAVYEVRYGKVRDWSDLHEPVQWMALCCNIHSGDTILIGSTSVRQKAIKMYRDGMPDFEVARMLGVPLSTVRGWLAPPL
jgi:hypothetical protein